MSAIPFHSSVLMSKASPLLLVTNTSYMHTSYMLWRAHNYSAKQQAANGFEIYVRAHDALPLWL